MRGLLALGVAGLLVLGIGSCSTISSVEPGHVGIKVSRMGSNAGVASESLGVGWYFTLPGTSIIEYPVSTQNYTWTDDTNDTHLVNDIVQFQDRNGLGLSAAVGINYHVNPAHASTLYQRYRMPIEQIVSGPLRNVVRDAISQRASGMAVEEIYGPKKTILINEALEDVQKYFSRYGLEIEQMFWAGNVNVPKTVLSQINAKIANEQAALAEQANVAKEEAKARAEVAKANGEAEAMRIRGEAIRTNPEILKQESIKAWNGALPVYMGGNTPMPFLDVRQ